MILFYTPDFYLLQQRNDDFIELDYTVLLHDIASQVKYHVTFTSCHFENRGLFYSY